MKGLKLIVAAAVVGVAAVLLISESGTFTRYRHEAAQMLDRPAYEQRLGATG